MPQSKDDFILQLQEMLAICALRYNHGYLKFTDNDWKVIEGMESVFEADAEGGWSLHVIPNEKGN